MFAPSHRISASSISSISALPRSRRTRGGMGAEHASTGLTAAKRRGAALSATHRALATATRWRNHTSGRWGSNPRRGDHELFPSVRCPHQRRRRLPTSAWRPVPLHEKAAPTRCEDRVWACPPHCIEGGENERNPRCRVAGVSPNLGVRPRVHGLWLVRPNRACITARVTSSASVIRGGIPTAGRAGARSGEAFNRSSVRT